MCVCVQCFPQVTKSLLQNKINGWRDNYIGGGEGGVGGVYVYLSDPVPGQL